MKLYYSPGSCALAVHIALEESGADYDAQRIDFDRQEQRSPEYLRLNPLGRVPVLETPRGVLTEVPAILAYIAATFPEAALAPADAFDHARMQSFNAFLSSTVHVTYAHYTRPYRWSDDEGCRASMKSKALDTFAKQMGMVEAQRLAGPWVMGDQYTVADPYLYVIARWFAKLHPGMAGLARVAEHHERMQARPAVLRALQKQGLAPA
jgi:glutathione S-transferase